MSSTTRREFIQRLLMASGAVLLSAPVLAANRSNILKAVHSSHDGKLTRLTFDLAKVPHYDVFTLSNPARLVVDLHDTTNSSNLDSLKRSGLFDNVRWAVHHDKTLRVVFDLPHQTSFDGASIDKRTGHLALDFSNNLVHHAVMERHPVKRDIIVVVDPGHGGKDPGATGKYGTHEKNVVLEISRMLKRKLDNTPGFRVVMTRDKDIFIPLRQRVNIAHKHKADVFVSVHADACDDRSVKGSSVYILSNKGASSVMARRLADRENDSDLIGGVSLKDKGSMLAKVLLDLSQTGTISASSDLAHTMIHNLAESERVLHRKVERAAFVVLKSPDIPSALVETAFISNPTQEKKLRTKAFQNKIANALHNGIKSYCLANIPERNLIIS